MGSSCWLVCQAAGGIRHWQDSMTFSSAISPCQLHKDGRFSAHCQVISDPVFSNIRCRQWQQQLLEAACGSLDNLHSNWFTHPFRQSFLCASESCKPSLPAICQLSELPCLYWPLCFLWWWRPRGGGFVGVSAAPGCWFSESSLLPRCWCPWLWWGLEWWCGCRTLVVFSTGGKDTFLQKSSVLRV